MSFAAATECFGISGCRYPCLLAKDATAVFFLGPLSTRDYDGVCAFRATYRTEYDAMMAFSDAKIHFPHVKKIETTVTAHFEPGAAHGFHVTGIHFKPWYVKLAETSEALLVMVGNSELRSQLLLDAGKNITGTVWSSLIAGMTEVGSCEEIKAHHSPGGYLLKVDRPITLKCLNEDWKTIDEASVEFLAAVEVSHIPFAVCKRCINA